MARSLTAALVALALAAPPWGALAAPSVATAVDRAATEFMAKEHVPGVAIAVVRHGTIVYEHGYGYADLNGHVPVTADTRFEIASITKEFTAACVLQLVRAGKLSLDDPLGKFITEYPAGAGVTIRQMLSHTSGLPEYAHFEDVTEPSTLPELFARIGKQPLNFAPGAKYSYSNTGYVLLGRIIELTAGVSYEEYVRTHVFVPAGMTRSGFISDEPKLPDTAVGYTKSASGAVAARKILSFGADGGVVSTIGDLVKWNRALAAGAMVAPADVKLLQTPMTLNDGSRTKYGLGFAVDALGGHPRVSHNGQSEGFGSSNAVFPRDDESIIVLDNLAQSSPDQVATAVFSALHPDVVARFNTAVPGEDKALTARLLGVLRRLGTGERDDSQFSARFLRAFPNGGKTGFVATELGPLGPPTKAVFRGKTRQPTMTAYNYNIAYGSVYEFMTFGIDANNKITAFGFMRGDGSDVAPKVDTAAKEDPAVTARVRNWLRQLAAGDIDRSQLDASFSAFFTPSMAARTTREFSPLGTPKTIRFHGQSERNGFATYTYDVTFPTARRVILIGISADGKIGAFAYGSSR